MCSECFFRCYIISGIPQDKDNSCETLPPDCCPPLAPPQKAGCELQRAAPRPPRAPGSGRAARSPACTPRPAPARLPSKPRELSQAGQCERREGNDTGRKKKQIRGKTQRQLGLQQPPARAPRRAPAPPPSGSRAGSRGPRSGRSRRARGAAGARRRFPGTRPGRREAVPAGGAQLPGPGGLSMPVRRRPGVLLPLSPGRGIARQRGHRPGRWRHSPMVATAAAAASDPRVSPPQPELHAGGPGGGDGSGPGSARGARAALGAPAACPGSGSGSARDRGLWHGQGGPLHPRRSRARPSPASAAPLGQSTRQVPQSRSRSVRPPFSTSGTLRKTNRWSRSSPPCLSLIPAAANRQRQLDLRAAPTRLTSQSREGNRQPPPSPPSGSLPTP